MNRSQFATGSQKHRDPHYLPYVFTEHGALMVATILNSPRAVAMSVYVIRAFVKMRAELAANATILKRLAEIDKTLLIHDVALREIFEKLRPLLAPPPAPPKPEIPRTAKALPLNGLALVRLANPLAIGVGAPKTAPYRSAHTPPTCGRYGERVPAWYLSRTCLVPPMWIAIHMRGTRQVRDRCLGSAGELKLAPAGLSSQAINPLLSTN